MEMHQVHYFLAVAETLNFTRAAEQCHVAQPSLTRAIQKLEDELGGLLFHRERQNTHLTELGRMMLPHLTRTYEAAQSARELARGIRSGEMAPLRVGIGASVANEGLMELFEGLKHAVNGVELTLRRGPEAEICEQALAGHHDLAFVAEQPELPERMRGWRLYRHRLQVALPDRHALARKTAVSIADLEGEELIEHLGLDDRSILASACEEQAIRLKFRHRVHSCEELRDMVRHGFGIGVVPARGQAPPGVVLRPLAGQAFERAIMVAVVAGRPFNRATEACLRLARNRDWSAMAI